MFHVSRSFLHASEYFATPRHGQRDNDDAQDEENQPEEDGQSTTPPPFLLRSCDRSTQVLGACHVERKIEVSDRAPDRETRIPIVCA